MTPLPSPQTAFFHKLLASAFCLSLLPPLASADTSTVTTQQDGQIIIPIGQQAPELQLKLPTTGMKKTEVQALFGTPNSQSAPVGKPPISRWVYNDFVVYFEYDHVVRSVKIFTPHNTDPNQ